MIIEILFWITFGVIIYLVFSLIENEYKLHKIEDEINEFYYK